MAERTRTLANSDAAFLKARQVMPGGVSSPVRAFRAVGGTPLFIKSASGCTITDIDGNTYTDYVASYGPMIAGHANERVVAALSKAIGRGTSYGAPTEAEVQLASLIASALPSVEMVRFVNSGTEATMSAIRLARAATGRDLIVKFVGGYHGHVDSLLVQAGSGALTLGQPSSPGVPATTAATTLSLHYNDLDGVRQAFAEHGQRIAGIIVEPIAGNMGVVLPADGFLQGLRTLCDDHGSLLIFDEVMTGFRVAWGGAQVKFDIRPDITCLGKVIGGGMPLAAYAGQRKLMELVSPAGPVYQAGTLSGNPVATAAGLSTLEVLQEEGAYDILEQRGGRLKAGLQVAADDAGVPVSINRVGSMLTVFFTRNKGDQVRNYAEATTCDTDVFGRFFHAMLNEGVYLPPSQYEAWFPGLAHSEEVIDQTVEAARVSFRAAKG